MKRLIHFARKKRQFKFQKKLNRRYVLTLLAMFGMHQLSAQQIQFAPPVDDPYGIFHHFIPDNLDFNTYEQQYYTEFIDIDSDGDLDLLFFENKSEYIYPNYFGVYGYYFQENTIDVNGSFGDTSIVDFEYHGDISFRPWNKLRFLDLDQDGDFDLHGIMPYYYGHSNGYHFKSFKNNTDQLSVFNFPDSEPDFSVSICSDPYDYSCLQYFEIGDLDNDSYDDLLIYSQTNYGDEIEDAKFQFHKNTGEVDVSPFYTGVDNPFNLDDIVGYIVDDSSNSIFDINIQDLNKDGTSELIVNYFDYSKARFLLECFFIDEATQTFEIENSQILIEYDSTNANGAVAFSSSSFLFVDLDKDGDLDMYNTLGYTFEDPNSQIQKLMYYENRTIITDTKNNHLQEVSIFPNPMNNQSIIRFENKQHQKAQINVFDAMGRQVQAYQTYEQELSLERKQLSGGIYTVQVKVDDDLFIQNLVVE